MQPGPIPTFIKNRFTRITNAYEEGIAIMSVADKATGRTRYLLCAVLTVGDEYVVSPVGEVFDEEAQERVYEEVLAP